MGNIELHLKPNLWYQHKHHLDRHYNNVILHVVWKGEEMVKNERGETIETLILKDYVEPKLLEHYNGFKTNAPIICASYFKTVPSTIVENTLRKQLFSRLDQKAKLILERLKIHQNDWEKTLFETIVGNFGLPINKTPFERLARLIDYKLIGKHRDNPLEIEALFFGLAGFLETTAQPDDHFLDLQKSYQFLKYKYHLDFNLKVEDWQFNRLRPPNFPTIRLAQLAQFFRQTDKVFTQILDLKNPHKLKDMFKVQQPAYWINHYHFGKTSSRTIQALGKATRNILIINALIPTLFARSKFENHHVYLDYALNILASLAPENNKITRLWKALDQKLDSAYDSQAHYALYKQACEPKTCMTCDIGRHILKV